MASTIVPKKVMPERLRIVLNHFGLTQSKLGGAIDLINKTTKYDRIIVITDEQARDSVNAPQGIGYMVNVASYQHAVGFGPWLRVDGWSEAIVDFITESEKAD